MCFWTVGENWSTKHCVSLLSKLTKPVFSIFIRNKCQSYNSSHCCRTFSTCKSLVSMFSCFWAAISVKTKRAFQTCLSKLITSELNTLLKLQLKTPWLIYDVFVFWWEAPCYIWWFMNTLCINTQKRGEWLTGKMDLKFM